MDFFFFSKLTKLKIQKGPHPGGFSGLVLWSLVYMDEGTGRVEEKTDRPLHWSVVRRENRPSITLAGVNILYQVRLVISL